MISEPRPILVSDSDYGDASSLKEGTPRARSVAIEVYDKNLTTTIFAIRL